MSWLIRITDHPVAWQRSHEVPTVTYGSGRCAEAGLQNHAEVFARLVQLNQRRVVSGQRVACQQRSQDGVVPRESQCMRIRQPAEKDRFTQRQLQHVADIGHQIVVGCLGDAAVKCEVRFEQLVGGPGCLHAFVGLADSRKICFAGIPAATLAEFIGRAVESYGSIRGAASGSGVPNSTLRGWKRGRYLMEPTPERSGAALFENLEAAKENAAALRAHLDAIKRMTGRG